MPSPFRILEILICAILGFLPYTVMMVYPFQNHLRLRDSLTALLAVFAAVIQTVLLLLAGLGLFGSAKLATLANMVIFIVFFLIVVRAPIGKQLSTLFSVLNQAAVITFAAGFLEERLFFAQAARPYSWAYALVTAGLQLLILTPFMIRWMKWYVPTLWANRGSAPWDIVWLVPALCLGADLGLYLLGFSRTVCAASSALLSLIAWLVCWAIFHNSRTQIVSAELRRPSSVEPNREHNKEPNNEPGKKPVRKQAASKSRQRPVKPKKAQNDSTAQLQQLQYCSLQERIAESDRVQQELRRHIDTMADHLELQDYDKLRAHLAALQAQFPKHPAPCCNHPALDPVLSYFSRQAGFCGVKMSAEIQLTGEIAVAGEDLAVLLGNLLDNALDACKRQKNGDRRIRVAASTKDSTVYLTVENTFELPAVRDSRGRFLSTRHSGLGTGIPVCQHIADRYNGRLEIYDAGGIFQVTATLNP